MRFRAGTLVEVDRDRYARTRGRPLVPLSSAPAVIRSGVRLDLLTTVLATLRERARKPSMPRMSAYWLMSHEREFNRLDY